MPGISFIADPFLIQPDHSVENAHLAVAIWRLPQVALQLELEEAGEAVGILFKPFTRPECCKLVTVNDDGDAELVVVEASRTYKTSPEAELEESVGVRLLPTSYPRRASRTHTHTA